MLVGGQSRVSGVDTQLHRAGLGDWDKAKFAMLLSIVNKQQILHQKIQAAAKASDVVANREHKAAVTDHLGTGIWAAVTVGAVYFSGGLALPVLYASGGSAALGCLADYFASKSVTGAKEAFKGLQQEQIALEREISLFKDDLALRGFTGTPEEFQGLIQELAEAVGADSQEEIIPKLPDPPVSSRSRVGSDPRDSRVGPGTRIDQSGGGMQRVARLSVWTPDHLKKLERLEALEDQLARTLQTRLGAIQSDEGAAAALKSDQTLRSVLGWILGLSGGAAVAAATLPVCFTALGGAAVCTAGAELGILTGSWAGTTGLTTALLTGVGSGGILKGLSQGITGLFSGSSTKTAEARRAATILQELIGEIEGDIDAIKELREEIGLECMRYDPENFKVIQQVRSARVWRERLGRSLGCQERGNTTTGRERHYEALRLALQGDISERSRSSSMGGSQRRMLTGASGTHAVGSARLRRMGTTRQGEIRHEFNANDHTLTLIYPDGKRRTFEVQELTLQLEGGEEIQVNGRLTEAQWKKVLPVIIETVIKTPIPTKADKSFVLQAKKTLPTGFDASWIGYDGDGNEASGGELTPQIASGMLTGFGACSSVLDLLRTPAGDETLHLFATDRQERLLGNRMDFLFHGIGPENPDGSGDRRREFDLGAISGEIEGAEERGDEQAVAGLRRWQEILTFVQDRDLVGLRYADGSQRLSPRVSREFHNLLKRLGVLEIRDPAALLKHLGLPDEWVNNDGGDWNEPDFLGLECMRGRGFHTTTTGRTPIGSRDSSHRRGSVSLRGGSLSGRTLSSVSASSARLVDTGRGVPFSSISTGRIVDVRGREAFSKHLCQVVKEGSLFDSYGGNVDKDSLVEIFAEQKVTCSRLSDEKATLSRRKMGKTSALRSAFLADLLSRVSANGEPDLGVGVDVRRRAQLGAALANSGESNPSTSEMREASALNAAKLMKKMGCSPAEQREVVRGIMGFHSSDPHSVSALISDVTLLEEMQLLRDEPRQFDPQDLVFVQSMLKQARDLEASDAGAARALKLKAQRLVEDIRDFIALTENPVFKAYLENKSEDPYKDLMQVLRYANQRYAAHHPDVDAADRPFSTLLSFMGGDSDIMEVTKPTTRGIHWYTAQESGYMSGKLRDIARFELFGGTDKRTAICREEPHLELHARRTLARLTRAGSSSPLNFAQVEADDYWFVTPLVSFEYQSLADGHGQARGVEVSRRIHKLAQAPFDRLELHVRGKLGAGEARPLLDQIQREYEMLRQAEVKCEEYGGLLHGYRNLVVSKPDTRAELEKLVGNGAGEWENSGQYKVVRDASVGARGLLGEDSADPDLYTRAQSGNLDTKKQVQDLIKALAQQRKAIQRFNQRARICLHSVAATGHVTAGGTLGITRTSLSTGEASTANNRVIANGFMKAATRDFSEALDQFESVRRVLRARVDALVAAGEEGEEGTKDLVALYNACSRQDRPYTYNKDGLKLPFRDCRFPSVRDQLMSGYVEMQNQFDGVRRKEGTHTATQRDYSRFSELAQTFSARVDMIRDRLASRMGEVVGADLGEEEDLDFEDFQLGDADHKLSSNLGSMWSRLSGSSLSRRSRSGSGRSVAASSDSVSL